MKVARFFHALPYAMTVVVQNDKLNLENVTLNDKVIQIEVSEINFNKLHIINFMRCLLHSQRHRILVNYFSH